MSLGSEGLLIHSALVAADRWKRGYVAEESLLKDEVLTGMY